MSNVAGEAPDPKLLFPALKPLYDIYYSLYWPLVRLTAGGMLFVHGYNKLMGPGLAGEATTMDRVGIHPAALAGGIVIFLETIGALCVVFGLFTRFFAAAICIEFAVLIATVHFANGFGWTSPHGGWEYPFFWGLTMLAIAMRGGGPLSLDRALGKEL